MRPRHWRHAVRHTQIQSRDAEQLAVAVPMIEVGGARVGIGSGLREMIRRVLMRVGGLRRVRTAVIGQRHARQMHMPADRPQQQLQRQPEGKQQGESRSHAAQDSAAQAVAGSDRRGACSASVWRNRRPSSSAAMLKPPMKPIHRPPGPHPSFRPSHQVSGKPTSQ